MPMSMPRPLPPSTPHLRLCCDPKGNLHAAIAIGIWQPSRKRNVSSAVSGDRRQSEPKKKQVLPNSPHTYTYIYIARRSAISNNNICSTFQLSPRFPSDLLFVFLLLFVCLLVVVVASSSPLHRRSLHFIFSAAFVCFDVIFGQSL